MIRSRHIATAALVGLLSAGGLIGCGHDREPLPGDAVILEQDKGVSTDRMMATVRHPGMIYVYDESDKRVVYTGRVQPGDSVGVDTFKDEIRIDNRTVAQPELDDAHRYQIYFDEDPRARVAGDEVYRREVREERQVAPAPAPAPQYNPDGTVIRRETTETQVPAGTTPPPAREDTVIRKETTETQVQPAPTPPPSEIRREETEIRREPAR
jgi:hypothetical protein